MYGVGMSGKHQTKCPEEYPVKCPGEGGEYPGKCRGEHLEDVQFPLQNYKSLQVVVMICNIPCNTYTESDIC